VPGCKSGTDPDPAQPGRTTGWSVTLPGLVDRSGQPVWFGGGTLDPQLRLGALRDRWRANLASAAPGQDLFAGFAVGEIYAHAARVGQEAATAIAAARPTEKAAIAWVASDLIAAAAEATGSSELARAAEGFARAARPAWGRTPTQTPGTSIIRTAAYLLSSCVPGRYRGQARRALVLALTSLARTLADLRTAQDQRLQSAAATAPALCRRSHWSTIATNSASSPTTMNVSTCSGKAAAQNPDSPWCRAQTHRPR